MTSKRLSLLIDRSGREAFERAADYAWAVAPATGFADGPELSQNSLIHELCWHVSQLAPPGKCGHRKLRLLCELYDLAPDYAVLMAAFWERRCFSPASRRYLWRCYRRWLRDDEALAAPVQYSLWSDWFADARTAPRAWRAVTRRPRPRRRLERVLDCSAPVPFALKAPLYGELLRDRSWHRAIYTSLLHDAQEPHGSFEPEAARDLLAKLVLPPGAPQPTFFQDHFGWPVGPRGEPGPRGCVSRPQRPLGAGRWIAEAGGKMNLEAWLKLQNGSDIRGVALGGVAGETVNLTPAVARTLGGAFARWLKDADDSARTVAVGNDPRLSGPRLKRGLVEGLVEAGFDVADCGLASTPAMFMATIHPDLAADGAIMLTASHLPFNRNGMKFFTGQGGLDKRDIRRLLELAAGDEPARSATAGAVREADFMATYAAHLVDVVRRGVGSSDDPDRPLAGPKILVDAGNGSGGFFADQVLEPLGAKVSGSLFLEPDGTFPNHPPNPESAEALAAICEAVVREKADLGIIFDTDVDRAAIVDRDGRAIHRNRLIALIAAVVLEEHPGSVIVTDSVTSTGLKAFIESRLGGVHHRYRRGYKNVIDEAIRLNQEGREAWLAIETSGHAALRENHFLDDGAYLVAKLLIQLAKMSRQGRALSSLIADLDEPVEAQELRLGITRSDFGRYGEQVLDQLRERVRGEPGWRLEEPNHEGIRVRCEGEDEAGWFLLRMSLHDPVMPLNVESDVEGGVATIVARLRGLLADFDGLDTSSLPG